MEKRRESKEEEKVVHETHDEVGNALPAIAYSERERPSRWALAHISSHRQLLEMWLRPFLEDRGVRHLCPYSVILC